MADGLAAPWPYGALLGTAHDLTHALEHELLDAFSFEGLGRVDVALGIDGNAVHAVELARPPRPNEVSSFIDERSMMRMRSFWQVLDLPLYGPIYPVRFTLGGALSLWQTHYNFRFQFRLGSATWLLCCEDEPIVAWQPRDSVPARRVGKGE